MNAVGFRWCAYAVLGSLTLWLAAGPTRASQPSAEEPPPDAAPTGSDQVRPGPPDQHGIRPPRSGADDRDQPPFFDRLRDVDRARVGEFLERHFPEQAEDLRILERIDERRFRRRMREVMPRILRLMRELERDEELGLLSIKEERLELKIHRAVRAHFRASDQAKREEIRAKIEESIGRQFDLRQQRSRQTIQKLERRIERLKERLQSRADRRQELLARELEMRLQPPDPPARPPGRGPLHRPDGQQSRKDRP